MVIPATADACYNDIAIIQTQFLDTYKTYEILLLYVKDKLVSVVLV